MVQLIKTLILALISLFFTLSLIIFPKQALEASVQGISIWWEVVFPSLLPFFIVAELLISFGVVQFFGVIFEPIMRPLFRVPGAGGFAWVMGMASGYPSGARISAQLRERNELSQIEAERLISFTNASSPLFIFGAIAIGFYHNEKLGLLIAVSHYFSNMIVGICMRFHGQNSQPNAPVHHNSNYIVRGLKKMHRIRLQDTRPLGTIMSEAIISSVKTLVMIGGFITLFSVLSEMFIVFQVIPIIANLLHPLFNILKIPIQSTVPFITGIFEITMGTQAITSVKEIPLVVKLILTSFILGLNGLSVQAQVASVIAHTDIRFYPYFIARLLHGLFASILTLLLYKPLYLDREASSSPVIKHPGDHVSFNILEYVKNIGPTLTLITLGLTALLMMSHFQKKHTGK